MPFAAYVEPPLGDRWRGPDHFAQEHTQVLAPELLALKIVGRNPYVFAVPERDVNRLTVRCRRGGRQGTVGANLGRSSGDAPLPSDLAVGRAETKQAPQPTVFAG
jgi:hypothetical protein